MIPVYSESVSQTSCTKMSKSNDGEYKKVTSTIKGFVMDLNIIVSKIKSYFRCKLQLFIYDLLTYRYVVLQFH